MSDIPSTNAKVQLESTQFRAPTSESLMQTMGGSINYALDTTATQAGQISTINGQISTINGILPGAVKFSLKTSPLWNLLIRGPGTPTYTVYTAPAGKFALATIVSVPGYALPAIDIVRSGLTIGTYGQTIPSPENVTITLFPGDSLNMTNLSAFVNAAIRFQAYEFDMTGA